MKAPLILIEGNDVQFFGSKIDIEKYLESPDVSAYIVFDANGMKLELISDTETVSSDRFFSITKVGKVNVEESDSPAEFRDELMDLLKRFLSKFDYATDVNSLESLIESVAKIIGYEGELTGSGEN